jgi:hypothetical protein
MNGATYPLDLFTLLKKHRKRVEQQDNDLKSAGGFVIGTIVSIALWCIILSIGIVIFGSSPN